MSVQDMHERLKKANERRNCGADEEITRLRAANAELVEALTEALELMPLGTEKRAKWLLKAGDIILSPGQTDFETRYQNRGHLMDAYVTALAEIADGRENPIEYARVVLRQGSKTLIESAKALSRAEQTKMEVEKCVWRGDLLHGYQVQCGYRPVFGDGVSTGKCPGCGKRVEVKK